MKNFHQEDVIFWKNFLAVEKFSSVKWNGNPGWDSQSYLVGKTARKIFPNYRWRHLLPVLCVPFILWIRVLHFLLDYDGFWSPTAASRCQTPLTASSIRGPPKLPHLFFISFHFFSQARLKKNGVTVLQLIVQNPNNIYRGIFYFFSA